MTRILIHSNAPNVSTGYGVQTRLLAERLHVAGHDVAVSCTYGQQGSSGKWRDITLYPTGYEVNGNDVIHNHALHHFGGDPLGGWIIPLLDVWCLKNPLLGDFNVAAWTPVDHFPVPPDVLEFFERTGSTPVAMSRYGFDQLSQAGLDPVYVPLAVDTKVYKPTPTLDVNGQTVGARELFGLPPEAFVVGMVGMNKGWARDRKGFNEAFRAFGAFWQDHNDAVLFMHSEKFGGAEGINLVELAQHAAIPEHAIVWSDQYAYRLGLPAEMMAAAYTAMDVLLAPSHGEGFCVPLIEAQACGTPVIVTDFSAQPELVGAGWLLTGQPEWDPPQHASYVVPFIAGVLEALEKAYDADLPGLAEQAMAKAANYDADLVFDTFWVPLLAELDAPAQTQERKDPIPTDAGSVAVIVPAMRRPHNVAPLVESLQDTTEARAYFVCDPDDHDEIAAVKEAGAEVIISDQGRSFATKANVGFRETTEPWVFLCGDDVEFTPGWLEAARGLSERFDVIGTNDAADGTGNETVQSGAHADHMLVRRSYVEEIGASLDGPGSLCAEVYHHFYVDWELVKLAKARGVFSPCLDSVVVHKHPGLGKGVMDDVYQDFSGLEAKQDRATFLSRLPLIEMQRVGRAKT